jgi:hypothetical protein
VEGVTFALAIAVVVERGFVIDDLGVGSMTGRLAARLDDTAASAVTRIPTCGATAAYLRQLAAGDPASPWRDRPVELPGRLVQRLADCGEVEVDQLLDGPLDSALAWERAAVLHGRTMTEWALREALRAA